MSNFLWYLASPYVADNTTTMHVRSLLVTRASAALTAEDIMVFSPIIIGHTMCERYMPLRDWDQEKWRAWSAFFMPKCDGLLVHMQDGWATSKGVSDELLDFQQKKKPIAFLEADFWSEPVDLRKTLMRIEYAKEYSES